MKLLLSLAILLGLGSVRCQQVISQCPDGWVSWQNFCYLFANTTQVTWTQAGLECSARQGHRLRVETADEYEFVRKALLLYPSTAYWTDLNDLPMNQPPNTPRGTGVFMWGSDEFPDDAVVKSHWDREPSNTDWEDCVMISMNGELSVGVCTEQHAFVCQINGQTCPPGLWFPGPQNTMCFYFSNVTNWAQLLTWDIARKTCESFTPFRDNRKASMLAITNPAIQTFLQGNLPYYALGSARQQFWTGLNDIKTEGQFVWQGSESQPFNSQYIKWRQEPNNLGGHENCGVLQPNAVWGDRECGDRVNFACRMALPDSPQEWNMGCGQWSRAGQKCVSVYNRPQLSWADARSFCQQQRGDLLKFDNEDDIMWVQNIGIKKLTVLASYWIGLNDLQKEGTYVWADGSSASGDLLNWDKEPNNWRRQDGTQTGLDQDCAFMGIDGSFSDRHCQLEHAGSICEEVTSNCKVGWLLYNSHCYLFDTNWRSHDEAVQNCVAQSATAAGRLFALSSQDEKTWMVQQIQGIWQKDPSKPYYYWSNLQDTIVEGQWTWMDDDEADPVQTQALVTWLSEPNNWGGNEDCIAIGTNAALNDMGCSSKIGFICARSVVNAAPRSVTFSLLAILLCLLASIL